MVASVGGFWSILAEIDILSMSHAVGSTVLSTHLVVDGSASSYRNDIMDSESSPQ